MSSKAKGKRSDPRVFFRSSRPKLAERVGLAVGRAAKRAVTIEPTSAGYQARTVAAMTPAEVAGLANVARGLAEYLQAFRKARRTERAAAQARRGSSPRRGRRSPVQLEPIILAI